MQQVNMTEDSKDRNEWIPPIEGMAKNIGKGKKIYVCHLTIRPDSLLPSAGVF